MKPLNRKISLVFRIGNAFMDRELEPYGLSSGLFYYIIELNRKDGITMQELSRAVMVDNAHTTRSVNKLTDMGYVRRESDKNDKRSFRVYLTDEGKKVSVIISSLVEKWSELLTTGISDEEINNFNDLYDRLYMNVQELLKK